MPTVASAAVSEELYERIDEEQEKQEHKSFSATLRAIIKKGLEADERVAELEEKVDEEREQREREVGQLREELADARQQIDEARAARDRAQRDLENDRRVLLGGTAIYTAAFVYLVQTGQLSATAFLSTAAFLVFVSIYTSGFLHLVFRKARTVFGSNESTQTEKDELYNT